MEIEIKKALTLLQDGDILNAENILNKIYETNPKDLNVLFALSLVYHYKGDLSFYSYYLKKIIDLDPSNWVAYYNLGYAAHQKGDFEEAISYYLKALQIKQNEPEIYFHLGNTYRSKGLLNEAILSYANALINNPNYKEAVKNLSDTKMDLGNKLLYENNFEEGWKEICESNKLTRYAFSQPYWDGSDIKDKTLLLYTEWGFGDAIQFARYIPFLVNRGFKIILYCQKELVRLFQNIKGLNKTFSYEDLKLLPHFDFQFPLLDMPLILGTKKENIPATTPYLSAPPDLIKIWSKKISNYKSVLNIGLVWSGSPQTPWDNIRSIPIEHLKILSEIEKLSIFSLQKGFAVEKLKNFLNDLKIIDFTHQINDFADTAAFIENLDLVISVDTSVAHLAGALGKPTWTLLHTPPDWRWLERNGNRSFWYPNMILFEQKTRGDWLEVLLRVRKSITEILNKIT